MRILQENLGLPEYSRHNVSIGVAALGVFIEWFATLLGPCLER
ncbi:hypothetical protein Q7F05_12145 [Pseudomonas sp. Lb2C1-1]|nr:MULTISPECIES: hypothetical protein [Pseudomonas]